MPDALPRLPDLPEPPLGRLNLLHHGDGRTVAVFDPKTGAAEPKYELADPESARDRRVRGRWVELRRGALGLYRDGADRVVVQHGRNRVLVPDGAPLAVRSLGPLLTLTVGSERMRMVDAPGHPGAGMLRAIAAAGAVEWV